MNWYERFGIGFVSSILYPTIKITQNEVRVDNIEAFFGAMLPSMFIGLLIGIYATLVEKSEEDRGKLFRMCLTMPAFIIGLATTPLENTASAEVREVTCSPISSFERGWYDAVSAITGVKRPRYYILSRTDSTSEILVYKEKTYFILGRFDKKPEADLVYDIDRCVLL
jgi:hypothetical protein